jgi:hypothetical protein
MSLFTLTNRSQDVPKLLSSAGSAISLRTNSPHAATALSTANTGSTSPNGIDGRKEAFLAHVRTYFSTLKGLEKALIKQTEALEDAGIIPAEKEKVLDGSGLTNGGLGDFDVAWLNSRRTDVGREKERELRAEVDTFLKKGGKDDDAMEGVQGQDPA